MSSFEKGAKFSSFSELSSAISKYSDENFIKFYIRDSRKIQARRRNLGRFTNHNLIYSEIKYACINGGRRFQKRGINIRQTKTRRQDCPAFFHFIVSKDGEYLKLNNLNLEHNHIIDETIYKHLPQTRRLPIALRKKAMQLLRMKVAKTTLRSQLMQETGKTILLKDLENLAYSSKYKPETLNKILSKLKQVEGNTVDLLHESFKLKGIFFQDKLMKETFEKFPEILLFNGINKVMGMGFVCYIFLTQDGNGNCEIVGVGLMMPEDNLKSVNWLIKTFSERNDNCSRTRIIVTEKYILEQSLFQPLFPHAKQLFCLFHVLRDFKQKVTLDKITEKQSKNGREYLKKFYHSCSKQQYEEVYKDFMDNTPEAVKIYFEQTLHPIRHEWTLISHDSGQFLSTINEILENVHSKLTSYIKSYDCPVSFSENLFNVVAALRNIRYNDFAETVLQITPTFENQSPEEKYYELLLPNPFQILLGQLQSAEPELIFEIAAGIFSYIHEDVLYAVNHFVCSCFVYTALRLPCRHIFSIRKVLSMDLYDADLCDQRWTRQYASAHPRIFVEDDGIVMDGCKNDSFSINTADESKINSTNDIPVIHSTNNIPVIHSTTDISTKYSKDISTSITSGKAIVHSTNVSTSQIGNNIPAELSTNHVSSSHSTCDISTQNSKSGVQSKVDEKSPKSTCCCSKYKQCAQLTTELTDVILDSSGEQFKQKLKVIEDLIACWKIGKNVALAELDVGELPTTFATVEI